jgi:hypothetical protein
MAILLGGKRVRFFLYVVMVCGVENHADVMGRHL